MLPPCDSDLASLAWPHWPGLTGRNRTSTIREAPQGLMEMAKAVWQRGSSPERQLQVGGGQWGTGPQRSIHLSQPWAVPASAYVLWPLPCFLGQSVGSLGPGVGYKSSFV